jgi:hypothetical protein
MAIHKPRIIPHRPERDSAQSGLEDLRGDNRMLRKENKKLRREAAYLRKQVGKLECLIGFGSENEEEQEASLVPPPPEVRAEIECPHCAKKEVFTFRTPAGTEIFFCRTCKDRIGINKSEL